MRHLGLVLPAEPRFPLDVPAIDLDALAPLPGDGPRIAVAPASRWESKNWPEDHFAAFVRRAVSRHAARVYLVGGGGDAPLAERIVAAAGAPAANLCGRLSLAESLGALARCETLLTNGKAKMPRWRKMLFAFVSKNARPATAYFGLPPNRVVELGMQVDL